MNGKKLFSAQGSKKYIALDTNGVAALITVTVIALIILIAGIGISQTGFVENILTSGEKESRKAFYAAEAGIQDAMERMTRNKDCNNGVNPPCSSYSFFIDNATVAVTVSGVSNVKTIVAAGMQGNKTRTIQVVADIDIATNKVTITSRGEPVN